MYFRIPVLVTLNCAVSYHQIPWIISTMEQYDLDHHDRQIMSEKFDFCGNFNIWAKKVFCIIQSFFQQFILNIIPISSLEWGSVNQLGICVWNVSLWALLSTSLVVNHSTSRITMLTMKTGHLFLGKWDGKYCTFFAIKYITCIMQSIFLWSGPAWMRHLRNVT